MRWAVRTTSLYDADGRLVSQTWDDAHGERDQHRDLHL